MEKIPSKKVKTELTDEELMNITGGYGYHYNSGWAYVSLYGVGIRQR